MALMEKLLPLFFQYLPSVLVCVTFLPCGLIFGYTLSSFAFQKSQSGGTIVYEPLISGAVVGLIVASIFTLVKFIKRRIVYWHFYFLLAAGGFNLISSCFYFVTGYDAVGAYISYIAHSVTFVAGLSFLHSIADKNTRAILISTCSCFYLVGMTSAISLILKQYNDNVLEFPDGTPEQLVQGVYVHFAGVYLSVAVIILGLLIGLQVLSCIGHVNCNSSMDDEFREANSNGQIFENRYQIIQRIQFFYVTKCQRWRIIFVMLMTEAIQYGQFIYFVYWFAMNAEMRLTPIKDCDRMLWTVFAGSVVSTCILVYLSATFQYVVIQLCLIVFAIISMIVCPLEDTKIPFWILVFLFGMTYSHLTIVLIEVSHFRYTELIIFISYFTKLAITAIIFYFFIAESKNSYFYSIDPSTLTAQGFIFIVITSLLALIVAVKAPYTHRKSLFHIQYELLGIIFLKHQIEELNVNWINDGTIPTISK